METATLQHYPFMETAGAEIKADGANILQQSNSYLLPFMETVKFEVELPRNKLKAVRTENQRLHIELGNSESEKEFFRQQVQELRSQL
jgi:predicted nuclease with TOPRIM domain